MRFEIDHTDKDSCARTGKIYTGHGIIDTPVFMPVGTAGTVKAVHQRELKDDIQASLILANAYHLYLRPGTGVIREAGGLHRFMGWEQGILTDSGGYQVFSLAAQRKINREGAVFRSHIDGSRHIFTPENVVDIQRELGADIIMAFDECTPYPCGKHYARQSMELTHGWLERGIKRFRETEPCFDYSQFFFPIVQGSTYADLRKISSETVAGKDMNGNAIGGLSVGEPPEEMYSMTRLVTGILPAGRPRYLMGVGLPENILETVALGIDMFDCVIPTRNGRNGMLFTSEGIINIRNEKWKTDHSPLDPLGTSFVDEQYSKAYLRHLIVSREMLGARIATLHNLRFYAWLMREAANKIRQGTFSGWKDRMVKKLAERL